MIDRREHFRTRLLPASRRFLGSSSPSGSTTQSTTSNPWGGSIPYLTGGAGNALAPDPNMPGGAASNYGNINGLLPAASALYGDEQAWPSYYPGSTYSPFTAGQAANLNAITTYGDQGGNASLQAANNSVAGMLGNGYTAQTSGPFNQMNDQYLGSSISGSQGVAQTYDPFQQSNSYASGIIGGQGVAATQPMSNAAQNYITGAANGQGVAQTQPQFNQAQGYLGNQIAGQGVGQTQGAYGTGQNYLQSMISGSTTNPFTSPGFQNVINGTLANVIPATSAGFINGGRSDSGLAQAAQTAAATNAIGSLANQNYVQEQGLQAGAESQASQNQAMQLGLQQQAGSQASQNQLAQQGLQSSAAGLGQAGGQFAQSLQQQVAQGAQQNYATQQGLQQGSANLAANDYLTQQGNQVKAAGIAPLIDQSQGTDLQNAYNAQAQYQNNNQNALNADIQKYNYQQTLPYNMLGMYQGFVGGSPSYGGSSAVSTPYYQPSAAAGLLGGAASGAAIGSMFGPGYGTAIGAGVGALGSLLAR